MAEFIVGVVFKGDSGHGGPFGVFFCDALQAELGCAPLVKLEGGLALFWRCISFAVLDLFEVCILTHLSLRGLQ